VIGYFERMNRLEMFINFVFSLFGFLSAVVIYAILFILIPYIIKKYKGSRKVSYKPPSRIRTEDFIAPFALDIGGTRTKGKKINF
jgi:hypothetical protein